MESKNNNISLKVILGLIAIGIWAIVLQNAGVVPTKQNVYVKGGYVGMDGSVRVSGSVDVDNMVDINLNVLGRPVGSHKSYVIDDREYQAIDVFQSNNW